MPKQPALTGLRDAMKKKITRREQFLGRWTRWCLGVGYWVCVLSWMGTAYISRGASNRCGSGGVDAPERDAAGFERATAMLSRLAQGQRITCREVDQDRYGRSVARCFLSDGREINRLMIESGTAREYRHFTKGFYSR